MPKRKLTAKVKKQILENPYRLRQADFSGEALKYLHRVRGARKAAKTKEIKKHYKQPKRLSEAAPEKVSDLVAKAAKANGLTEKQFRRKFPKETEEFERTMTLKFSRDMQLLKNDIKFLPEGARVINKGKKIKREQAQYLLTRLYNKFQGTSEVSERLGVKHFYDGAGNLHLEIPTPDEYSEFEGEDFLEFMEENYDDIDFYRSKNKGKK